MSSPVRGPYLRQIKVSPDTWTAITTEKKMDRYMKHNYCVLQTMVDSGLRIRVKTKATRKCEYWKMFDVKYDDKEKYIRCWFRRGKQIASFSEMLSRKPVVKYRGNWKPFDVLLCSGVMRGDILLKNKPHNMESIVSSQEKSILKLRRGRKSAAELQFLNRMETEVSNSCPGSTLEIERDGMIEAITNAISKTHKTVVTQTEIRDLLKNEENEIRFFEKLGKIIETNGNIKMNRKRMSYSHPPDLPKDLLFVQTKPVENPHTFTNARKSNTRQIPKSLVDFASFDEAMHSAKQLVSNTNARYVVWPPNQINMHLVYR